MSVHAFIWYIDKHTKIKEREEVDGGQTSSLPAWNVLPIGIQKFGDDST
jgi:hypothetical protein